jgi:adenylosuccinate synthase
MPRAHAFQVVDLAYGDAGKGTLVDYLVRRHNAHTVVRFNGGPQAGHNVVTPDGRHHTFAQFGSGTFVPGVRTLLSCFMLIEPYALFDELAHLESLGVTDALERLTIDADCPVITPIHQAANRLRELARGANAHGTCGLGIGETVSDTIDHPTGTIRARDLADRATLSRKLRATLERKTVQLEQILTAIAPAHPDVQTLRNPDWIDVALDVYAALAHRAAIVESPKIPDSGVTVFEGAQGVLLDETFGFHPHTTWSNTTFANADKLLDEAGFAGGRTRIGVLRTYFSRHGAGPFVTEDASLRGKLLEPHNNDGGWQGQFRVGLFDAVAARYALKVTGGVDLVALTHVDRLPALPPRITVAYEDPLTQRRLENFAPADGLTTLLERCRPIHAELESADFRSGFVHAIQRELNLRVGILSSGPTALEKEWLGD